MSYRQKESSQTLRRILSNKKEYFQKTLLLVCCGEQDVMVKPHGAPKEPAVEVTSVNCISYQRHLLKCLIRQQTSKQ